MSDPKRHHYVPKVYLQSFADASGNLFVSSKKYPSQKRRRHISQVCYSLNYFTITKEETAVIHNVSDPNIIEKQAFQKQENSFQSLLQKLIPLTLDPHNMVAADAMSLISILINIKRRNPSMKDIHTKQSIRYLQSDQFPNDVAPAIAISRKIDNIDSIEYIKKYILSTSGDPDKLKDLYLRKFLDNSSQLLGRLADTLFSLKWHLFVCPENQQFLTSDNPGFTLAGSDTLLNAGGFGGDFVYVFPVTHKHCVVISSDEKDVDADLVKAIYPVPAPEATIDWINNGTIQLATDKVLSFHPA